MTITTEFWFNRNNSDHIENPIKDLIATMQLAYARDITDATQTYRIAKNYDTEKVQQTINDLAPDISDFLEDGCRLFMSNQCISVLNPIGDLLHIWRCDGDDIIDITAQHTQALEAAGSAVDMFH